MDQAQWADCLSPEAMLNHLTDRASPRKLRLYAIGCCRRIWHLLSDERCRHAVHKAQDFVDGRAVRTWLNGDLMQDGSTKDMVFDVPALVAHVSSAMTLLPGDVILTGTPEGVGPMQVGDEVEVSVAGIGNLTSKVAARD